MKKKLLYSIMAGMISAGLLTGCQSGTSENSQPSSTEAEPSGNEAASETGAATSQRDVTLSLGFHMNEKYDDVILPIIQEFQKLHPEVKEVTFTGLSSVTDEQQVTRLTGGQYEDVVLIPSILLPSELPNYFAPLGTTEEMAEKYYYGDYLQVDGQSYGCPIGVVYEGIIYNQDVLDQYCDGIVPKTLDELMDCCEKLHENGITCFYTNAGSVWPMRYWDNLAITMSGDNDYANKILTTEEPWAEGTPLRQADDLLAQFAKNGWLEADVVSANQWDVSLASLASGDTAFIFTGTWALSQAQDNAEALGLPRETIGFMPFPYKNDVSADNPLKLRIAQDLFMAVNKNTEHMELAQEFVRFFCERISLPLGMNETMIDGGQNQPELEFLSSLDYVEMYTSPAKDNRLQEMAAVAEIDVFAYDGYLLDYIMIPSLNGEEPQYDKLNELWGKNFK